MPSKKPATPAAAKAAPTKKELSTNNFIAAVIAVTLIIVIVCGLIGKGMVSSLITNTKVIAAKVTAKNALDTKLTNIPTLLQNYQNLGAAKQTIADGLPNDPDFPQLISVMQGISTVAGVPIKSISANGSGSSSTASASGSLSAAAAPSPAPSATPGSPTPYVFSVSVTAPYAQMLSFFHNLEISDRPMHVTSAHFSGTGSSITVDLTIQTYYQAKASVDDTTEAIK